jgi:hypothetical protein
MFVPFESGFVVSDEDVLVKVGTEIIPRTTIGIWDLSKQSGFEDRTLPDGRLAIVFGTSVYGTRPKSDDSVNVTYVTTSGLAGNNAGLASAAVTTDFNTSVTGTLDMSLSGGADELPAFQYKNIASQTFGTFGSAVTKRQYHTMALQYPGIIDVVMFAQRETDPTDLRRMNLIKVVALTNSGWNISNAESFIEYLQDRTMFSTRFYVESPSASPADISVRLYCYNWANLSEVQLQVESAIRSLFEPRAGYIDYDLYKSDIGAAIRASHQGIEYFELLTPTEDLIISAKPVGNFVTTVAGGVGTLPIGTYYYGVGVNVTTASGPGYIKPKSIITASATVAASTVSISWSAVPNATSYVVYGRDGTGLYELATLPATTLSFNDDGSAAQGTLAPTKDVYPVQYLTLNTLTVTANYSARQRV